MNPYQIQRPFPADVTSPTPTQFSGPKADTQTANPDWHADEPQPDDAEEQKKNQSATR